MLRGWEGLNLHAAARVCVDSVDACGSTCLNAYSTRQGMGLSLNPVWELGAKEISGTRSRRRKQMKGATTEGRASFT